MANVTPLRLNVHEILERVEAYKLRSKKIEFLKAHNKNFALLSLLQLNFHPLLKLDLPEGAPPYKKDDSPVGYSLAKIKTQVQKLGLLVDSNKSLPKIKKEKIFTQILESIHANDADVIITAKDKKLSEKYPSITEDIIREAFPKLILDRVKK